MTSSPARVAQEGSAGASGLCVDRPDSMTLPETVVARLGVQTSEVDEAPPPTPLVLSGQLVLDANRMIYIHTRFPGEVVGIGTVKNSVNAKGDHSEHPGDRPLQFGDRVTKGQRLAVVWCKDVGEKKSDLVDAITRMQANQVTVERLEKLPKGAVADQTVREAKRTHETDVIQVERLERTLRSWRIDEQEMEEVYAEAARIHRGERNANPTVEKTWGEIEIRAPFDGVILEKNVVVGDIVDSNQDLFKIADLGRLGVLVNVFEEDLPALHALPQNERKWQVRLKGNPDAPPIYGEFSVIGKLIDPEQHTGRVLGWVDNSEGNLYAGQFISARVQLPRRANEVAIPESAVVEGAPLSRVMVADGTVPERVTQRRVVLLRHMRGKAIVRSEPNDRERKQGAEPLRAGERVVSKSVIELLTAMDELSAKMAVSH
ncbi:MAG TPA: efflux RND transporter periplasmic adaptor subunit [Pirellulales bacterium]|nr:efflux RND transporter periplasmic adaptor subunit [Pirellulales bacterium]